MARRKRRSRTKPERDPFLDMKGGKGTPMTIRVSSSIVDMLDMYRADMATRYGAPSTRAQMLENLLNHVWREKFIEAMVTEIGGKLSDQIGNPDDDAD